jgi:hypothetical protein
VTRAKPGATSTIPGRIFHTADEFSGYALRMLMYAGSASERLITIEDAARTFSVSKTHLNKVVG